VINWTKSPYKNPYSAGKPIWNEKMFFGRDELFQKAHARLVGEHPNHPIVIYGQRRMGKTSVLTQMERRLNAIFGEEQYVTVLLDLQAFTLMDTDEFWEEMADFIQLKFKDSISYDIIKEFGHNSYATFREIFLPVVKEILGERRLVLMFDESIRFEEVVKQDRWLLMNQLLTLMESEEQISFIYSLATPVFTLQPEYQEMLKNAFLLHVTYFSEKVARALVREPVAQFYQFSDTAIKYLLTLTGRHPYFTQAICNKLFFRWERQQFKRATLADVEAVLDKTTNSYMINLSYLWIEATVAEKFVLGAIAEMEPDQAGVRTLDRHLRQASIYLGRSHIKRALKGLHQREIIDSPTHPRINLGILRYWLRYAKGLWLVSRKFREYLPPMPKGHTEPQLSPALTIALTKPWVRTPTRFSLGGI
jgi:hypothetical protein